MRGVGWVGRLMSEEDGRGAGEMRLHAAEPPVVASLGRRRWLQVEPSFLSHMRYTRLPGAWN